MPTTVIDIRTKYVGPNAKAWRMFPGLGYSFIDIFRSQDLVFLDFPDLDLPDGRITNFTPLLRERILRSKAIGEWKADRVRRARAQIEDSDVPPEPSRKLADYLQSSRRHFSNDIGSISALFGYANAGDLIVVPDRRLTRSVMVGELIDPVEKRITTSIARYGSEPILARRVKWLRDISIFDLPIDLIDGLRKQNPMTQLAKSYHSRLLDETYNSYYTNEVYASRFRTTSADFTGKNNRDFAALSTLFAALCYHLSSGDTKPAYESIWQVFDVDIPADFDPTIACDIHSPGTIDLKSPTLVPIYALAMFTFLSQAVAAEKPLPTEIKIVNSVGGESDGCTLEVDKKVKESFDLMQFNVYRDACMKAQALKAQAGMVSDGKAHTGTKDQHEVDSAQTHPDTK